MLWLCNMLIAAAPMPLMYRGPPLLPCPAWAHTFRLHHMGRLTLRAATSAHLHAFPSDVQARRLIRPLRLCPTPPLRRGDAVELVCLSK